MLIYGKNNNSIDIYDLTIKHEDLSYYRRRTLNEHIGDDLFYTLKTNDKYVIKQFESKNDLKFGEIIFDDDSPINVGKWSYLKSSEGGETPNMFETKEQYIEGYYDNIPAKRIYIREDGSELDLFYFLNSESVKEKELTYEYKDMLNIPRKLYYLDSFLQGKINENTINEVINHFNLFEIKYLKNIDRKLLADLFETKLIEGSMEDIDRKVNSYSKILKRVK